MGNMPKYRFHGSQSLTEDMPTFRAVYPARHPFDGPGLLLLRDRQCDIDLAWDMLVWIPQATLPQSTVVAVFLVALKL